jgi:hypothetical protein
MAIFTSYAPPGVYTQVLLQPASAPITGTARIPVIIGEGQQFFQQNNIELFRGSSAVQDDQSVNENISDQVTGFSRNFQTTFFPVTDGTGHGVVTNDPTKVQVQAIDPQGNVTPVTVISLDGATGQFSTQLIIPPGTDIQITYFFKRGDTQIINEDLSYQIPSFAVAYINSSGALSNSSTGAIATISTTNPGDLGNLVTLQFVSDVHGSPAGGGVPDALAVIGGGTDAITINISEVGGGLRTVQDLINLFAAGIPTLDAGYLTITPSSSTQTLSIPSPGVTALQGGAGQSTNTVFKTKFTPIVDGTNGGVVTTDVTKVTVEVNGSPVAVTALDGQHGLVTLAAPVLSNVASFTITYWYNTWTNTYDLLPSSNVASIIEVGLGPNRSDYDEDIDFSLGKALDNKGNVVANTVNWGNNVTETIGVSAAGELANFTPSSVLETLVDELVYLRPLQGAVNGKNTVFTIPDTPVDGSNKGKITDDVTKISVYVGSDPLEAFLAGPVKVARLSGLAQQVTLYNPPQANTYAVTNSGTTQVLQPVGVWATYYRNTIEDHTYTISVVTPGYAGFGTYTIANELGEVVPLVVNSANSVAAGGFLATGIVYPFGFPDAQSIAGAPAETVTLTFNNDGNSVVTPAVQASKAITFTSGAILTFTASVPGVGGNSVTIAVDASSLNPEPVVVNGDAITIYSNWDGGNHSATDVAGYFPSAFTPDGGQITAAASGSAGSMLSTTAATPLSGGTDAVTTPVSHSYTVTSSLGAQGSSGKGYLDQTYIDARTLFRVTIVNPSDHASYGVLSIPAGYNFAPGDTLTYVVTNTLATAVRTTGNPGVFPAQANNQVAIPGLLSKVISTYGSTTGDTVLVETVRLSGNNPSIGQFYYVTFTVNKTAADYGIKIYTNPIDAYNAYGTPSTINRLSLGIQFMVQNGVQTFGAIQVPVQPGTIQASAPDYIAAIQTLTTNLPGTTRKADVVVPLSTDPSVHQFLSQQLTTLATLRYKGEGIGFVGYDQFQTPSTMRANARSLSNKRMLAIGNPAAGVLITDQSTGVSIEYLVSGEFMAAAMAGLSCNPANDVATSLTNQNLVGFSRLLITYDDPTMDAMAADGLIDLLNNNGALKIRHYKSTDPSSPLTSEPTTTTISDYVSQVFRSDLAQFIGRKLVDSLVTDIQVVCNARLTSLVNQQIITAYQNLTVVEDPVDPTQVDVTVTFKPIFSLLYVLVTFTVVTNL